MMLTLLSDNFRNSGNSCSIMALQHGKLLFEVPKYNALYRNRCGRDSVFAEKTGDGAKDKPADPA